MTNTDRDDGDLRHVFLETARGSLCHLCLKPENHIDHVPHTVLEQFAQWLPTAIDEARE